MSLRRRLLAFGFLAAALLLLSSPAWWALIRLAREHDAASHTLVAPVVAMALIVLNRRDVFARIEWSVAAGSVLTAAGVVAWLAAAVFDLMWGLTVQVGGLVVAGWGLFLLCFGRQAFRSALFPLLFLGLALPLPERAISAAIAVLKDGSTELSAALFSLSQTPFHRDGYLFHFPDFSIRVDDECSGIRSSIALLIMGLLAGHAHLKRPFSWLLLMVAILPLAIIKNAVRIVSLSMLATHVHPGFLTGHLHNSGGVVFFMGALGALYATVHLIRLLECGQPRLRPATHP